MEAASGFSSAVEQRSIAVVVWRPKLVGKVDGVAFSREFFLRKLHFFRLGYMSVLARK